MFKTSQPVKRHTKPLKDKHSKVEIKPSHEGLLHKDTHTPAGQKIPKSKLNKAAHSKNPAIRKRAIFVENFDH